jgi:hypothetical protein
MCRLAAPAGFIATRRVIGRCALLVVPLASMGFMARSRTIGAALELLLARVGVRPAGPPVAAAWLALRLHVARGPFRLLWRFPQFAAREVPEHDVLVGAPQLRQRRQQFLLLASPERRRFAVDQDGPVDVSGRHTNSMTRADSCDLVIS